MIGIVEFSDRDITWKINRNGVVETLATTGNGRGMNPQRFQRLREMELDYYFHRVAQTTKEYFVDIYHVEHLEIIGTQHIRDEFVNGEFLDYHLRNILIVRDEE
jgi:peptide chain release factor subunit 1